MTLSDTARRTTTWLLVLAGLTVEMGQVAEAHDRLVTLHGRQLSRFRGSHPASGACVSPQTSFSEHRVMGAIGGVLVDQDGAPLGGQTVHAARVTHTRTWRVSAHGTRRVSDHR